MDLIKIKTTECNLHVFLSLTGHAFTESKHGPDHECAHGFYWAMRWLARQVLGNAWVHWIAEG